MHYRVRLQVAEALGSVNRWYCSEAYGFEVDNPDLLLAYYIQSGGAADFAERFDQAMGAMNRWYCSEFYRREISDPEILWEYYMNHAPVRAAGTNSRYEPDKVLVEMSAAS
jgi:hypothetical protein